MGFVIVIVVLLFLFVGLPVLSEARAKARREEEKKEREEAARRREAEEKHRQEMEVEGVRQQAEKWKNNEFSRKITAWLIVEIDKEAKRILTLAPRAKQAMFGVWAQHNHLCVGFGEHRIINYDEFGYEDPKADWKGLLSLNLAIGGILEEHYKSDSIVSVSCNLYRRGSDSDLDVSINITILDPRVPELKKVSIE